MFLRGPYAATFGREFVDSLRQPRAWAVFLVAALFFALAFQQGGARVSRTEAERTRAEAANWAGWIAQDAQNPHAAAHYPMLIAKPAAPLGGLAEGVDAALGGHVFTDAHRVVPVSGNRASDMPLAASIGELDAAFVVGGVLSLLAVLWSIDVVAGDKERGILRLIFANAIGRRRWLAAKIAGRLVAFWALGSAAALLAWALTGGVPLGTHSGWRLFAFFGVSALYLGLWTLWGAFCSSLSVRVAPAALLAIGSWVLFVGVVPRLLTTGCELASPPPPTAAARVQVRVAEVKLRREQQALVEAEQAKAVTTNAVVSTEGSSAVRKLIDEKATAVRLKADAPLAQWRSEQFARLDALSYISPAALYAQVASSLAGSDASRHTAFLAQAGRYRQGFLDELNGLEDQGHTEYSAYDKLARFHFVEASASRLLADNATRLGFLLALAFAVFAASLWRFRRYDLR